MSKKYIMGWCGDFIGETDKAFSLTYAGGYTSSNDVDIWFPKSQCLLREPNEYGNRLVYIPKWLFVQKSINPFNFRDFDIPNGTDGEVVL